jgi:hypothetical protein
VVRIVPRPEREEFVNAGVIVFCLTRNYLAAKVRLDAARVRALCPTIDLEPLRRHLNAIPRICAGDPDAGPIARLPIRERFQWLAAPRSTVIQVSPAHSGLCDTPERTLETLFERLVAVVE